MYNLEEFLEIAVTFNLFCLLGFHLIDRECLSSFKKKKKSHLITLNQYIESKSFPHLFPRIYTAKAIKIDNLPGYRDFYRYGLRTQEKLNKKQPDVFCGMLRSRRNLLGEIGKAVGWHVRDYKTMHRSEADSL